MARRGYSLLFAGGMFVADCLALVLGFIVAYFLRFQLYPWIPLVSTPLEFPALSRYLKVLPFVLFIMILSFRAGGLYRESLAFIKIVRAGSVFKQVFYGVVVLMALSAMYREISFSRIFGVFLIPVFSVFVVLGRMFLIRLENRIRRKQGKKRRVIIVGEGVSAVTLVERFSMPDMADHLLLGTVTVSGKPGGTLSNTHCLGAITSFEALFDQHSPDEVILSTESLDHTQLTEIISACDRRMIQFYIVPDMFNLLTTRVELTSLGGINLLGLEKFPLDNGLNRSLKRILDILGSVAGLLVLSPIFLACAGLIKATSRGPVFFKQTRCREDGNEFIMFKLRTMREDAEKDCGPVFARKGDDRCTPIGKFLRNTNLDELPQLINVLQGHMSLVGPRPERPHFIQQFKFDIPRYMNRHHIKPGMTGWAQVHGFRGDTSLEERVKYDIYYIENWSIWLDLKIIFLTFFSYRNAY